MYEYGLNKKHQKFFYNNSNPSTEKQKNESGFEVIINKKREGKELLSR